MPNDFRAALAGRILVADGAMGTMLQAADLSVEADFQGLEGCNEILNVTRPDVIRAVHDAYLAAGSDCVETNTFGANLGNLGDYHIPHRIREPSEAGARIARQAADAHTTETPTTSTPNERRGSLPVLSRTDIDLAAPVRRRPGAAAMIESMRTPRAVAIVVDGPRALVIKRFLRREFTDACVMCEDGGRTGPRCLGHHYAVLPGGHVEAGETAEAAALRELNEETTLEARIDRLLWTGLHNGRPASYFLMTDVRGTAVLSGPEAEANGPSDSFELRWAAADEFDHLNLHPADVREPLTRLLRPGTR